MSEQAKLDKTANEMDNKPNQEGVKSHYENIKDALNMLYKLFPKAFLKENIRPLKLGIFNDIKAKVTDIEGLSITKVRAALRVYTTRIEYLQSVVEGNLRIDLDGNEAEAVTKEHQEYAQGLIEQLKNQAKKFKKKPAVNNRGTNKQEHKTVNKKFGVKSFTPKSNTTKPFAKNIKKPAFGAKSFSKGKDDVAKVEHGALKKASIDDIIEGKTVLVSFNNRLTKGVIKQKGPKDTVLVTLEKGMTLNLPIDRIKLEDK